MVKIFKKRFLVNIFTRYNLFVAGRHSSLLERAGRARQLVSYELNIKRQTPYSEVRADFSLASTGIVRLKMRGGFGLAKIFRRLGFS
jgi:hypothetical protein